MPPKDPCYDELIKLALLIHKRYDIITFINIDFNDRGDFIYDEIRERSRYNQYIIVLVIAEYIKIYNELPLIKQNEFKDLLKKILINNYNNIKYDLTIYCIFTDDKIYEYMKSEGFLYLLFKIKPEEIVSHMTDRPRFNWQIRAREIYEEHMKLRWTWMKAIMISNEKMPDIKAQKCAIT